MNKTALITGASGGIGSAFAEIFAREQYDLILIARTASKLNELKIDLQNRFGISVRTISCDLLKPESAINIYRTLHQAGTEVDVLINNAGVGDWGYFVNSDWEKQDTMLQLNIAALTRLTHLFLPMMVARGSGQILNVASTAAFQPGPLMSVYFATKAYVLSFSSAIAHELKNSGVTVTCLCPGPTTTDFQKKTFSEEIRLNYGRKLPTAADVAEYGYKAMKKGTAIAVPGLLNKFLAFSSRILPRKTVLNIVNFMQTSISDQATPRQA